MELRIQLYTLKELPPEFRSTFVLKQNPYQGKEAAAEAIEFLRAAGVFFYRDSTHTNGVIIKPDDGDDTPMAKRSGFLAYKHSAVMTLDADGSATVDRHPNPTNAHIRAHGDDLQWLVWNRPHTILEITTEAIRLA